MHDDEKSRNYMKLIHKGFGHWVHKYVYIITNVNGIILECYFKFVDMYW